MQNKKRIILRFLLVNYLSSFLASSEEAGLAGSAGLAGWPATRLHP